MKKNIIFITLLSIAFCASAQKEDNFQFGGFANVNRCANIKPYADHFKELDNTRTDSPLIGYQFGFLLQYAFSDVSKIQFGIGMAQTGIGTVQVSADKNSSGAVSFESQSIHQDLMLPILYKRQLGRKSPFYIVAGLTPLLKVNRSNKLISTFSDNTRRVINTRNNLDGSRNLNINPSLGIGYEIKFLKNNYLFLQPNFEINGFSLDDFAGNKKFYMIGLTLGILSK